MRIAAGELDRRITIWRSAEIDDGTATVQGPPVQIAKRWARKRDVSDAERIRAAEQEAEVTTRFLVRSDFLTRTIGGDDVIRYKGRDYGVTGVKESAEREDGIEISTVARGLSIPLEVRQLSGQIVAVGSAWGAAIAAAVGSGAISATSAAFASMQARAGLSGAVAAAGSTVAAMWARARLSAATGAGSLATAQLTGFAKLSGNVSANAAVSGMAIEPEAATLIARMTVAPTAARRSAINSMVRSLKSAGIWAKLDCLYVMAAHAEQASRLNWLASTNTLSPINGPTFTVDRGYMGDGVASYLDTGWNNSAPGRKFAIGSSHMGVWVNSGAAGNATWGDAGNNRSRIKSRNTDNFAYGWAHTNTTIRAPVATALGHTAWSRRGETDVSLYRDGASLINSSTVPSATTSGDNFFVGATSSGGLPIDMSARQYAALHWGASLTDAQMAAFSTILGTYLSGIGAQ